MKRGSTELDELLSALADGDRSAFQPVYARASPVVLRFARRMLGEDASFEDVAQEVLLKVFARAHQFDRQKGHALTWILQIAAFEVMSQRKRQKRSRETLQSPDREPTVDAPDPEAVAIQRDLEASLAAALEDLRPEDLETLLARVREDPRAIGPTFRKRFQRAMDRLRSVWRAKHEID